MSVVIKNIVVKNNKVKADVIVNGDKNNVWYEFPNNIENICKRASNAFLIAFLPIAMKVSDEIIVEGVISKTLYNNLITYQEIMTKWYPELNKVKITTKIEEDLNLKKEKIISCFTAGVDAFYTTLKNLDDINTLLYVWGFDIPLTENIFFEKVKSHLKKAAKDLKKEILLVKTNLGFEVTNKYASWGDYVYGAAIASVVTLMNGEYKKCLIPSCNDYSVLTPRGSHILINHLWSCDNLEFVYEGAEKSRIEKVDYIANNKVVQNHLRVCWQSKDEYNCCTCEKCIRTMVSLEALSKLKNVKTFSKKLDIKNIHNVELNSESEYQFALATLNVANKKNKKELSNELEKQIRNYKLKKINNYIKTNYSYLKETDTIRELKNEILNDSINNDTKNVLKKVLITSIKKIKNKLLRLK